MLARTVAITRFVGQYVHYDDVFEDEDVPNADEYHEVDVRDLAPPKPLKETLETLESMEPNAVLVQVNDRVPQHLFPKLEDRGYAYHSVGEDPVYTAIWSV